MLRVMLAAVLAVVLVGCPPKDENKAAPARSSTGGCSKIGQSCEFAPGKLGTCVQRDDCPPGGACFVCQSQH